MKWGLAGMRNKNLAQSFGCARAGICHALKTQRNLRIHLIFAAVVLILGGAAGFTRAEMAILALASGLVIACEIINTAIEKTVDLFMPVYSPVAKRAKDLAAGAVLASAVAAAAAGLILFLRREVILTLWGIIF